MIKKRKVGEKATILKLDDEEEAEEPKVQEGGTTVPKQPVLHKPVISSSTTAQKLKATEDVKNSFDELKYKANNAIYTLEDIATLENQAEPDKATDARAKFIQNVEITKKIKQGLIDNTVYRGLNGYANYTANEQIVKNSKHKGNFGPLRAPTNIRVSCRFDYNPELCKDWHDSGYCVFGNSCLYIHDRTDYKTGWELQKDYEQQERQRWKKINNPDYVQQFQFKEQLDKYKVEDTCKVCKKEFKEPVSLECGHIFCMKCANFKNRKCLTCNKTTNGIMNDASQQLRKQRQKFESMKKQLEQKAQANKNKKRKVDVGDSLNLFK